MAQIVLTSPTGMIAVCVRNDGFFDRLPWVNVKIALPAVKTFVGEFY